MLFRSSIGRKGYFGTGLRTGQQLDDFWEWDQLSNTWTQVASFPGGRRYGTFSFSLSGKGYVGAGWSPTPRRDFYEFDPAINTWTRKADFPGTARYHASAVSSGTKAYVGFGFSPYFKDWWVYDPVQDSWTQKTDFPGTAQIGRAHV